MIYKYFNVSESYIHDIKKQLGNRNVICVFNDDHKLVEKLREIRNKLPENYLQMTEENERIVEEFQKINDQRDYNFVYGDFGITKFPEKKFQILGLRHLLNGKVIEHLKKEKISYAVFVPTDELMPLSDEVEDYVKTLEMINGDSRDKKIKAMKKIKHTPIRRTMILLHKLLNDNSGRIRKYAAQTLGYIQNPKSIDYLVKRLDDSDMLVRWTTGRALSRFKHEKVSKLALEYLSEDDRDKWTYAALLLHETNLNEYKTEISQGLDSEDPYIRSLAINMIGRMKNIDEAGQKRILNYFSDKDPGVREEAIRLMSRLNPKIVKSYDFSKERDKDILNFVESMVDSEKLEKQVKPRLNNNKDKVKGSIYGTIIGDAMGLPIEGLPIEKIKRIFGTVDDYVDNLHRRGYQMPAGSYSDDGELALEIINSVVDRGYIDPYDISKRFGEIGKQIDDDFDKNIGYGYMALMAFRKLYAGVNWRFTGNDSTGCGAAMRVAPVSAQAKDLEEDLIKQAKITHKNNLAIAGSLAIGYAIQKAYDLKPGFDKQKYLDEIIEKIKPISLELATELQYLNQMIDQDPAEALEQLPLTRDVKKRKGKGTLGTIPCALYSFLHSPDDFEKTLITSINHSGDSDSIGAMACAISGAYNGFEKVPSRFVNGLHDLDYIKEVVHKYVSI